ncbi:MAG: SH3 domain-containing protein [Chloroflexi bacterium]|nr:SH3 domain-containing protein [Chloroflexota bacterium]
MKAGRETPFAIVFLILSILACNMPGAGGGGTGDSSAQPSPGVTYVVVVEDTATAAPTDTPIPVTVTAQNPPKLTLTKNTNCRLGPSAFYNIVDQIASGKELPVIGRSEDNEWWQVVNATGRECWVFTENATPNQDFGSLVIGEAPPLPGVPLNFFVVDQNCQSAQKKFSVTLSWSSGGGETAFRIYRDGNRVVEYKATRFNFKDTNAPYNKNIVYEIEAVNENGTSAKATQIVPACK